MHIITDADIEQLIKDLGTPVVLPFCTLLREARRTYGPDISQLQLYQALIPKRQYESVKRTPEEIRSTRHKAPYKTITTFAPNALARAGYELMNCPSRKDERWTLKIEGKLVNTTVYVRDLDAAIASLNATGKLPI